MSIVFLNGKFLKDSEAKISILDHGFLYGDGVYETLRTYGGKIWQLKEHLRRLRRSARFLGLRIPFPSEELANYVKKTVRLNGFRESRIRISLSRGGNHYDFTACRNPTISIVVQELIPELAWVYEKGVAIASFRGERALPEAKSISLLPLVLATRHARSKKAYEALFVDEKGMVTEGTITNVFMVRDGVLMTPKSGILAGTTREFLLKLARKEGIAVREISIKLQDLYRADEVFITNAPRGIIPVVRIDGRKVGKGKPGNLTRQLRFLFQKNLVDELRTESQSVR